MNRNRNRKANSIKIGSKKSLIILIKIINSENNKGSKTYLLEIQAAHDYKRFSYVPKKYFTNKKYLAAFFS